MISETKVIKMHDGTEIAAKVGEIGSSCWVIATHGVGEHMGRHMHIPELLGHKFNIFQYDLRGHGKSSGERSSIDNFFTFVDDLNQIIDFLRKEYRMERYFLYGHSMGALITSAFVQQKSYSVGPEMVFLSAPPVSVPGALGKIVECLPINMLEKLACCPVGLKLGGLVDLKYLSNDVRVANDYVNDPLVELKMHTSLVTGIAYASRKVFSKPLDISCPGHCVVGSGDMVVSVPELKKYFTEVEKGFQLKVIEGAFHEIHNEIDKYRTPYRNYIKETFLNSFYKN